MKRGDDTIGALLDRSTGVILTREELAAIARGDVVGSELATLPTSDGGTRLLAIVTGDDGHVRNYLEHADLGWGDALRSLRARLLAEAEHYSATSELKPDAAAVAWAGALDQRLARAAVRLLSPPEICEAAERGAARRT